MQEEGGDAALLGGQLQAPPGDGADAVGLAQDRRQGGAVEAFLHGPQDVVAALSADHHEASRIEAEGVQARCVEAGLAAAPQHRPGISGEARQERGAKAGGGTPFAADLVQGGARQPAPGQGAVDFRRSQGQHAGPAAAGRGMPFEPADAGA